MDQVSSLPALRVSPGWWGGWGGVTETCGGAASAGLSVLTCGVGGVVGVAGVPLCSLGFLALQQAVLAWAVSAPHSQPFRDHP